MKKVNETPNIVEQLGTSAMQKGKVIADQRTSVAEQQLRMVPMIAGLALIREENEKKIKQKKRIEERVKRLRPLGHSVNYVFAQEEFYPATPIAFTEQDLHTIKLAHQDPLVVKL